MGWAEGAIELVPIVTTGDRIQDRRLMEAGGKALFVKEIEQALIDGAVDLAVHSMKDVPAETPDELVIAAIPEREDPRDAFIGRDVERFEELPTGAKLGTASLRRQAQALAARPDLQIEMLRGNVDTRLQRLADADFDAILLACSGLERLGRAGVIGERLSLDAFLPAPGQGALAIQTRAVDAAEPWAMALNHADTALAVAAERAAMRVLEGSCRTAIGAHAVIAAGHLRLTVEQLHPNGSVRIRRVGEIDAGLGFVPAIGLGEALGRQVHESAADDLGPPESEG